MFRPRALAPTFARARAHFPAIVLTGPRQSGKSTLLRHEAPDHAYVTFDDPLERDFARRDPHGFLARFPGPVTLDEVQYVPELLGLVKLHIDRARTPGQFLITGSQQFAAMAGVTESLAGRAAILELLPFSLHERPPRDLAEAVWLGGYPEPALHPAVRDLWLSSYIATYLERDVRQLGGVSNFRLFETFLAMCAARHGQELNLGALGADCGVSAPTVKSWLGVLEASYVAILLQPWFRNYGKRLVKSPKLYFVDPALVCGLTRQPSGDAALAGPMGGAFLEGLVVLETHKAFVERGQSPAVWFWRSHDGLEVDLLVQTPRGLLPIEVKLTATPTDRHTGPLQRLRDLAVADVGPVSALVCSVPETRPLPGGCVAVPWQAFPAWLRAELDGGD